MRVAALKIVDRRKLGLKNARSGHQRISVPAVERVAPSAK